MCMHRAHPRAGVFGLHRERERERWTDVPICRSLTRDEPGRWPGPYPGPARDGRSFGGDASSVVVVAALASLSLQLDTDTLLTLHRAMHSSLAHSLLLVAADVTAQTQCALSWRSLGRRSTRARATPRRGVYREHVLLVSTPPRGPTLGLWVQRAYRRIGGRRHPRQPGRLSTWGAFRCPDHSTALGRRV